MCQNESVEFFIDQWFSAFLHLRTGEKWENYFVAL